MEKPTFVYVTYIATTPEKLWEALTSTKFTRQYWHGFAAESEWEKGSSWRLVGSDGKVWDAGEILEVERPTRLVIAWRHEMFEELREAGFTRATFELEPKGEVVKLTVTHEAPEEGEKFIAAVSNGWPQVLASLKTLLETGSPLPATS